MTATRGCVAMLTAAAILWIGLSAWAQDSETFEARLSTVPVDATTARDVTGSGSARAVLAGNELSVTGAFSGLSSPATVARLHTGPKGIRGPAVFDLTVSKSTSGTITGSLVLTPAQINALRKSRFYVQVHSEKAPDGNLWGWLLK